MLSLFPVRRSEPTFGLAAGIGLVLVLGLMTIILVEFASSQFVGYDSYWHVFIARQDTWSAFWQEVRENAHPPLFYLALGLATDVFGLSFLSYRLLSILATLAATVLIAQIVWRLTNNSGLAVVAGAAFGLSCNATVMALEVRAYSMGLALLLLAVLFYLDWIDSWPTRGSSRNCVAFALTTSAAMATSYQALFFLPAAIISPVLLAILDWPERQQMAARAKRYVLDAPLMFGLPVLTTSVLYTVHMRLWDRSLVHVPQFMFDSAQDPSVPNFLSRKGEELASLFMPGIDTVSPSFVAALMLGAVTCLTLSNKKRTLIGAIPIVMLIVMLGMNMAAGVQRRYPFGGELRHEFFLFPFVVVSAFSAADPAHLLTTVSPAVRNLWSAALACLVALNLVSWLPVFPLSSRALLQDQMDRFHSEFGVPLAVNVDQFNFMNVFAHHHGWAWHVVKENVTQNLRQVWSVSDGRTRFFVCRQREWHLDLSQQNFYRDLLACGSATKSDQVAVFRPQQHGFRPNWNVSATEDIARRVAPDIGLEPERVVVDDWDVYASFRRLEP